MLMYFALTGMGILLFIFCLAGLIWALRSGQLDDLETPALRMLMDDNEKVPRQGHADTNNESQSNVSQPLLEESPT